MLRFIFLVMTCTVLVPTTALALPNFARREGVGCATCHTLVPRLNRTGYEYRNSGYRMPDQLGIENTKVTGFGDFNSVRSDILLSWLRNAPGGGSVSVQDEINVVGASLNLLTGAVGKNFASRVELDVDADGAVSVANMFVRGTYGSADHHANLRIGVTHPWEGYGGSDLPAGISLPLIMSTPAGVGPENTVFAPQLFNQAQIEAGYTYKGFNVAVSLLNGILVQSDGTAEPAVGGAFVRSLSDPNHNTKDFQVVANQFLGEDSAISGYYYHGTVSLPVPGATTSATWGDTFDRVAFFGTWAPLKRVWALGGVEGGWDHSFDPTTAAPSANRFFSGGLFAEVDGRWTDWLGGVIRYDFFAPSRGSYNVTMNAATVALNALVLGGLQGILEYQFLSTGAGSEGTGTSNSIQLHLFYAF